MHMKRFSDEMLKHTNNILACLYFVWLKYLDILGLKHSILQTTIFVRNERKQYLIFHNVVIKSVNMDNGEGENSFKNLNEDNCFYFYFF
jgi:hypothetical protein